MKKRVLIVGEHPFGPSGNSGMSRGILSTIDKERFDVCFLAVNVYDLNYKPFAFNPFPYSLLTPPTKEDCWGKKTLFDLLQGTSFDVLFMLGIDIWRYVDVFQQIDQIRQHKRFSWIFLFPYDIQSVRKDWVTWINIIDVPRVYSKYGAEKLKGHVEGIEYFRPSIQFNGIWKPQDEYDKRMTRMSLFPSVKEDHLVFAFVGNNIFRKDIQGLIEGFAIAKKKFPDMVLYLHTYDQKEGGICNIQQVGSDNGLKKGDILMKTPGVYFQFSDMVSLYNSFDCLVNCTIQEGLSWTPLEAMLCGTPVILSNSTAHPELVENDAGILVECKDRAYVPLPTKFGEGWVDAFRCNPKDIAEAIFIMAMNPHLRERYSKNGLRNAQEWLNGISDVNELLEEAINKKEEVKITRPVEKKAVLFAQHSSGGDVLMTTRCFKGLKERHPGLPLRYMTSSQYIDIVTGNPYLDEILEWNEEELKNPEYFLYNPHGEKILPGHWGRNSNSILADFYWKILDVEPDDFFIDFQKPKKFEKEINSLFNEPFVSYREKKKVCVVHTTGGDPHFRTYKYMSDVCKLISSEYKTVQLGTMRDYPAGADYDFRGLSFRESAWIMGRCAQAAVTVDSFVSHLAGALGVPQVCLFGSGNHNVVKPLQKCGKLVCMTPDYIKDCEGLGPCSASVRNCPTPCTGAHDPVEIAKEILEL